MTRRPFPGSVAVVTGAASGLGRAIASHLAAAGARIAALDIDHDGLERLTQFHAGQGREVLPLTCDVTDRVACQLTIDTVARHFGRIDWLVANAGISHRSPLAITSPDVIRRVVEVNFFGAVHVTQAALPHLLASRGSIVAVSSVAGYAPLLARTGYAASKHALHGFFDSLRSEVATQGVSVTIACPSFVDTAIDRHALDGEGRPARHPRVIVGRPAAPEAVAAAICAAAAGGRRLVLVGRTARLAWWLSRCAPALYEAIMARRMRAEMLAAPATTNPLGSPHEPA